MSDAGEHDDKLAPEPFERSHTLLQAQHEREEVFRAPLTPTDTFGPKTLHILSDI